MPGQLADQVLGGRILAPSGIILQCQPWHRPQHAMAGEVLGIVRCPHLSLARPLGELGAGSGLFDREIAAEPSGRLEDRRLLGLVGQLRHVGGRRRHEQQRQSVVGFGLSWSPRRANPTHRRVAQLVTRGEPAAGVGEQLPRRLQEGKGTISSRTSGGRVLCRNRSHPVLRPFEPLVDLLAERAQCCLVARRCQPAVAPAPVQEPADPGCAQGPPPPLTPGRCGRGGQGRRRAWHRG